MLHICRRARDERPERFVLSHPCYARMGHPAVRAFQGRRIETFRLGSGQAMGQPRSLPHENAQLCGCTFFDECGDDSLLRFLSQGFKRCRELLPFVLGGWRLITRRRFCRAMAWWPPELRRGAVVEVAWRAARGAPLGRTAEAAAGELSDAAGLGFCCVTGSGLLAGRLGGRWLWRRRDSGSPGQRPGAVLRAV